MKVLKSLWKDDAGFVVSSELILIATITVLSLVVGLSEVSNGVNEELEDVGSAVGSINQTLRYGGSAGHKGFICGSSFVDGEDYCDGQYDLNGETGNIQPEGTKNIN